MAEGSRGTPQGRADADPGRGGVMADWEWLWLPAAVLAPCVLIGVGQAVFGG